MVAVKGNLQEKWPTSERLKRTHAYIVSDDSVLLMSFCWKSSGIL